MRSKKAQGLSMTTIIIVILAVIVLIVIAIAFSGGFTNLWKKILGQKETYWTQADVVAAKNVCDNYCTSGYYDQFCSATFSELKDPETGVEPHCYESPIKAKCKKPGPEGPILLNAEGCKSLAQEITHLECQEGKCVEVPGEGENKCESDKDCAKE